MKLYVKNMVCDRCISAVTAEINKMGIEPVSVQLGTIELPGNPGTEKLDSLSRSLDLLGFELLYDAKTRTVEAIKQFIIQQIHHMESIPRVNFSTLLSEHLHRDYSYLSKLFSGSEGITIEQYIILQKTERVKELLLYNELSLSQIADDMGYSSVAHLSGQFKKVTGETISHYKNNIASNKRKPIDHVSPK
ncbi:MAG: helix-turn-helix transcriptional regulator [Bacteroidetes bacterium]|nr:helix-turn-helix transcriptional regulator [Bacteroidota bacterium]